MVMGLEGVSTHSRPKAAGFIAQIQPRGNAVSTHSRPKAAGENFDYISFWSTVSTHSRPKAAGPFLSPRLPISPFQLTAARRRLAAHSSEAAHPQQFQLTAARRRLDGTLLHGGQELMFQLTAARRRLGEQTRRGQRLGRRFNSQPPEGGWRYTK